MVLCAMLAAGKEYKAVADILDRTVGSVEAKARAMDINVAPKRERKDKSTLCWQCANATNSGCLWSKHLRPVTGWTAKYRPVKAGEKGKAPSYVVEACPEFVEG